MHQNTQFTEKLTPVPLKLFEISLILLSLFVEHTQITEV